MAKVFESRESGGEYSSLEQKQFDSSYIRLPIQKAKNKKNKKKSNSIFKNKPIKDKIGGADGNFDENRYHMKKNTRKFERIDGSI